MVIGTVVKLLRTNQYAIAAPVPPAPMISTEGSRSTDRCSRRCTSGMDCQNERPSNTRLLARSRAILVGRSL